MAAGDNPTTSFDGIAREPTNAELLANWRNTLLRFPFILLWLALEALWLDQGWAALVLQHAIPVYCVAVLATFWRECAAFTLTLSLALWSGCRAFWRAAAAEFRVGLA